MIARLLSWWRGDDLIDALIANNAARYLIGYERPEYAIMGRLTDERRWATVDAEYRLRERLRRQ